MSKLPWLCDGNLRLLFLFGVLIGASPMVRAADCHADFLLLDVVSPQSITTTGDPDEYGEPDKGGPVRAFIFPSLPPCIDSGEKKKVPVLPPVPLLKFFIPRNRFAGTQTFKWSGPAGPVSITVERKPDDSALVTLADTVPMRLLGRDDFARMQSRFVEWLFKKSHCGFFVDCHRRFNDLDSKLIFLWKALLAQSTFENFSDKYLGSPKPDRLEYAHCSGDGCVGTLNGFTMSAIRILPRERLRITWGNNNVIYSSSSEIYSRFSSGGSTDVPVIEDHGLRLRPQSSCSMTGRFQAEGKDPAMSYPYPPTWVGLFGRTFLPIYSEFDLASTFLLKTVTDATYTYRKPPACPDDSSLKAPANLFLLVPTLYTKGDSGEDKDGVSNFEFEARNAFKLGPAETLTLLSQQFILVGCDSAAKDTVEREWITMLGRAYAQTLAEDKAALKAAPVSPCGGYVSGVFSGKAFLEIREGGFTLNGHAIEGTFGRFQPLGQSILSIGGTAIDIAGKPVELWRSTGIHGDLFGSSKVEVLFHGTAVPILDQTDVREGDAVYVLSLHEALR